MARKLMIFFVPVLIAFSLFNWSREHHVLAIAEAITTVLLLFSITLLHGSRQSMLPWIASLLVSTLGIIIFIDGGVGNMAFIWMVMIPFIYFVIAGQQAGWLLSSVFLCTILLIYTLSNWVTIYNSTQVFVFTLAYALQTMAAAAMNFFRIEREQELILHIQQKHQQMVQTEKLANQEAVIWQEIIDYIDDAILVLDEHGNIIKTNKICKNISPFIIKEAAKNYTQRLLYQQPENIEEEMFFKEEKQWFSISVYTFISNNNKDQHALLMLKNITHRKERIDQRDKILFHLQGMEYINHTIATTKDPQTILINLMTAIRTVFKADRAWLLTPCDMDADSFSVPIESTTDSYPGAFVDMKEIPIDDDTRTIFESALASNDPITFPSMPESEWVQQYSIRSQMLFAIHGKVGKPWLLGIHQCDFATDWDEKQRDLFKDMGMRIADIIDAWQLNISLESRSDQYRQLVENMPDGVMIILDQHILFANEVMLNMMAITHPAEHEGQSILDYIHPDFHAVCLEDFDVAIQGHRNPISEIQLINREGDIIDVISNSTAISYQGKTAIQFILRDVTLRHRQEKSLQKSLAKNKQLAIQLIEIQEQERVSIAQNLHDDSGQLLTAISMNLASIKGHIQQENIQDRVEDTEMMLGKLFTSIRSSLETLNPTHIDTLGLSNAIRNESEKWALRYGIEVTLNISNMVDYPNPQVATAIYRIIQEALTNIAKHAKAKKVSINLYFVIGNPAYISLNIKDDGCGFDSEAMSDKGFGLFGMQARSEHVSATLKIDSHIGCGTTLHADFPLEYDIKSPVENELQGNLF